MYNQFKGLLSRISETLLVLILYPIIVIPLAILFIIILIIVVVVYCIISYGQRLILPWLLTDHQRNVFRWLNSKGD